MSAKSSDRPAKRPRLLRAVQAVLWVAICFVGAQVLVGAIGVLAGGSLANVLSQNVLLLLLRLLLLVIMVGALLWLPRLWGEAISRAQLGLKRSLKWSDIGWGAVGMLAAYGGSILLALLAQWLMTWVDLEQPQNLGLSVLTPGIEMGLALLVLVVIGPIVEELIFRGYLYGKLEALKVGFWLRTVVVSVLFALAHFQWNIALDVFVLSVIMCILREKTGSLWPAIVMHMLKNGVAFYLMFVNPLAAGIL